MARKSRPNWASRHDLLLYFVLAYALSWSIWPLVVLNPTSAPLVPFGPLIAAAVVSLAAGGRRRLNALLAQLTRWRVHVVYYLIAVTGPFLVSLAAARLTVATGAPVPRPLGDTDPVTILVTLLTTILMVGLFEEVGWRGFALPRLQRRMPTLWAALTLGGIWALWHLPVLTSDPTGQRPLLPFVIGILAQSLILAWLYNNSGLLIVIIFHAAVNTATRFTLTGFAESDYHIAWWAQTGLYVLLALLVIVLGGSTRASTRGVSLSSSVASPVYPPHHDH
ncbi:MAG TPA: type II CAAX endopeptidase family protein [Propionibacteriaceae bacterium]